MSDNIKKYTESIKKTIDSLDKISQSVDSKIRELVTVLSAAQQGLIQGEDKITKALEGVSKGKFESSAALGTYLKQLDLVDEDVKKIINSWEKLQDLSIDELKRSKEYSKLITELPDLFDEINDTTKEIGGNTTDILDNIETQTDLVSSLTKRYQEFSKNILENKSLLASVNIDLTKNATIATDFLNTAGQVLPKLFNTELINPDSINNLKEDFNKLRQAWMTNQPELKLTGSDEMINLSDAQGQISDISKKLRDELAIEFDVRNKLLKQYIASSMNLKLDPDTGVITDLNTGLQLTNELLSDASIKLERKESILNSISDQLAIAKNLSADQLKILSEDINKLDNADKILVAQLASQKQIVNVGKEQIAVNLKTFELLEAYSEKIKGMAGQIDQIGDSFQGVFDVLPFGLQRMLGIENIGNRISDSITTGMESYVQNLAAGQSKMQALSASTATFGRTLSVALGPITLIVAAIAAAVALVKGLEDKVSNISQELGVSRSIAKKMVTDSQSLVSSSNNRFITESKILEIQKAHLEKYGRTLDLSKDLNKQMIDTAVSAEQAYGIMSSDAMEVMNIFQRLGADDSLSQRLLADVAAAAELAGISPNIIAKDLIDASKEVSLYFAGMPKQAAKAAIQIRRMGMSLKQAGQIADKMLNIEGFMTDMYELAAMTSGKLNLSEAFDLRMKGDIEGMTKSIMNQIGSLDNFNSQSEFVQRKLASTLGMEVDELKKAVKLKEMSHQLSEDQVKVLQQNLDKIGDIENMSVDNMRAKAEELNSTKKLAVAFDKIKSILFKALVPIAESFAEVLSSSTGIIEGIGAAFKLVGSIIKLISPVVSGFLLPFKWLGDIITVIAGYISSWFDPIDKSTEGVTKLNAGLTGSVDILSMLGKTVGVIFGARYLGKITGINTLFSSVFTKISGTAATTGTEVAKNLTKSSIFTTITDKFKSFIPKISNLFSKVDPSQPILQNMTGVDVTKPLIENAEKGKGILERLYDKINIFKNKASQPISNELSTTVTQEISKSAQPNILPDVKKMQQSGSIFDTIVDKFKKGGEILKGVFSSLKELVVGFFDMIGKSLAALGSGIGEFFKSTIGGIGDGLSKFQPKALIGTAAMIGLSSALWIMSNAMQNFQTINWESLAKAGVALAGLAAITAGIGAISSLIIPGAIAIGIASAALFVFAKATKLVGESMASLEPLITAFFNGIAMAATSILSGVNEIFATLSNLDVSSLLMIGPALVGISAGLIALGAGSALTGLISLLSNDPFKKLEFLASLASPLNIVATSVKLLSDSINSLNVALNDLNFDKLEQIKDEAISVDKTATMSAQVAMQPNATQMTPITPISTVNEYHPQGEIKTEINNTTNSSNSQTTTAKVERLLGEVRDLLMANLNKPAIAVLQDQTLPGLNQKLKGMNNK